MQWHQERQEVLAHNVSHANTPNFRPSDLAPPDPATPRPGGAVALLRTNVAHLDGATGGVGQFQRATAGEFEVRPAGNAVNLEDEMLKVAANQMDYQAATALYARGLGLLKTALGRRS